MLVNIDKGRGERKGREERGGGGGGGEGGKKRKGTQRELVTKEPYLSSPFWLQNPRIFGWFSCFLIELPQKEAVLSVSVRGKGWGLGEEGEERKGKKPCIGKGQLFVRVRQRFEIFLLYSPGKKRLEEKEPNWKRKELPIQDTSVLPQILLSPP